MAALGLALLIGAFTSRAITVPLLRLRRSMKTVAGGEFVAQENLPYDRQDEIGDLSRSYRSMTQRLAELDRLKAEFIGIATHELKTPLNVITGYAELIEEGVYGEVTPKQKSVLGSIRDQVRILARMVNQLLDISRLEAGGFHLQMSAVRLPEIFEQLQRTFEPLARKKKIDLQLQLEDSVPGIINADGERLRDQVLGNLLSNAFKFTPEGGRIVVRAWREGPDLKISVKDSGVGIPAEHLPHVFEKWHQVGEARSKGAGLGLNIVHGIIEAHGGTVSVESHEGQGTTFCITIPAAPPAALEHTENQPVSASGRVRAAQSV